MNIALLHYSAPPVVGGVESVLAHHARLMADAGHSVRVIAGRGAQADPRIPFIPLPLADSRHPDVLAVKAELDAGRVPPAFDGLVNRLTSALEAALDGAEAIVAHNVCSLHKNLALTAALRRNWEDGRRREMPSANVRGDSRRRQSSIRRLILWHHDLAWTTPRYAAELHNGYPWDLLRTAWPGATQVVVSALRQRELARLIDVPEEGIAVVPNGVDANEFLQLDAQTQQIADRLKLAAAEPLLLLPVRITPRKNIELALRTLAALRAEFPRAALVVTGPPGPHNPANAEYFARLKALRAELGLEGAAHFLAELALSGEYLPDEVIFSLYRLADALLMPSREEGFGIPIVEAGLARLPIFCADIPPLRELGGEQAAYFSPDADPHAVAVLIAERLGGDSTFILRARLRNSYTWEGVYTQRIAPLLNQP